MCQDTRFFLGFPVSCKLSPTAVRLGLGSGSGSLLLSRESYPLTSFISAALISFHSFFLNHLSGFVIVIICSPHVLLSLGFSFVLGNLRCPPPHNWFGFLCHCFRPTFNANLKRFSFNNVILAFLQLVFHFIAPLLILSFCLFTSACCFLKVRCSSSELPSRLSLRNSNIFLNFLLSPETDAQSVLFFLISWVWFSSSLFLQVISSLFLFLVLISTQGSG